mmetsp:Transcript_148503/g.210912  ORF Transcript_148503/g.210912 Transcript_148503/m.210912 type:complete len:263 (-) Transcript_148503:598-1386(-)
MLHDDCQVSARTLRNLGTQAPKPFRTTGEVHRGSRGIATVPGPNSEGDLAPVEVTGDLQPISQLQGFDAHMRPFHVRVRSHADATRPVGEDGNNLLNVLRAGQLRGEDDAYAVGVAELAVGEAQAVALHSRLVQPVLGDDGQAALALGLRKGSAFGREVPKLSSFGMESVSRLTDLGRVVVTLRKLHSRRGDHHHHRLQRLNWLYRLDNLHLPTHQGGLCHLLDKAIHRESWTPGLCRLHDHHLLRFISNSHLLCRNGRYWA